MNQFASMESQKNGSVSMYSTMKGWARRSTPRFLPFRAYAIYKQRNRKNWHGINGTSSGNLNE